MPHFGLEGLAPILLYAGMYVAFLASVFWRPNLGIYLLVLTLPLQTGRYRLHDFPLGSEFIDILLLGTILGLVIQGKSFVPRGQWTRFLLFYALFCYLSLWEGSYFLRAPLPLWISDARFSDWKNYVEMFLLALVVASSIKSKNEIRLLLAVMTVSLLVVNRSYFSTLSGRDLSHFSYEVRDAGPLGYAGVNGLAAFEAMLASMLLGIAVFTRRTLPKVGIYLIIATCCYCLLFSFSRGGYLGLLIGIMTVGLFKSRWLLGVAALLVIGWQTLLPVAVQERIAMTTENAGEGQQFEPSAQDRINLWEDAMGLFKRNPITGTGFQTYESMGRLGYADTHNYYLKVLAETGIIGFFLFLVLLWKLFGSGMRLFFITEDPFWRGLSLGFIALLASTVVLNLFGDRWSYQQVDGYLWVVLGCVISGMRATGEESANAEAVENAEQLPGQEGPQLNPA
ncbi:MAG TPA: O-antigen ligase family protein [Candidatus Angelobacter sp.]